MQVLFITVIIGLIIDQASKYAVLWGLGLSVGERYDVLPPFLVLTLAWNDGVNFGLFGSDHEVMRWLLIALSVVISIWLALWANKNLHKTSNFIFVGLIIAGALGNALDRVFHSAVIDFINMSCCGINNPYVFNIADIEIFIGAIGLLIFSSKPETNS